MSEKMLILRLNETSSALTPWDCSARRRIHSAIDEPQGSTTVVALVHGHLDL